MAAAKKAAKKASGKTPATEAAEQTEAPPAPQAEARPPRPTQNGVSRPSSGTATGRVWEIADSLSKAKGEAAARGEVMKAGEAENLNPATIATQYGRWRKFYGLGRYVKPVEETAGAPAEDGAEVEEGEDGEE